LLLFVRVPLLSNVCVAAVTKVTFLGNKQKSI
jgi:hypothetical protein